MHLAEGVAGPDRDVVLSVRGLKLRRQADPIDLDLHRGEILGLAGLDGHGQEEFLEILAGLRRAADGTVEILDAAGARQRLRQPKDAVSHGVVYLPRDRKTQGILPTLSVLDNFAVATLPRYARLGVLARGSMHQAYRVYHERLAIHADSADSSITALSGGNQQKVLLARWLAAKPQVLLLNDPTRGVDMATRRKMYEVFREVVSEHGMSLVLLSSQLEELMWNAQRVLVFRDGTVFATLSVGELTSERLIAAMFGRSLP